MAGLGAMYTNGSYVKQDFGKALGWCEKSIEAGNADAPAQTANMYLNGRGVRKDYAMAAQYFRQAADLGDGYALKFLANMYEVGFRGPPDLDKAGALRFRARQVDPDARDVDPIALFRRICAESQGHGQARPAAHRRRRVI
jgi:TPR repeat protein